ncbi:hypothetical protein BD311DRAFT_781759 [Dichomitus squalens]|uniref:Uncharacterized protein n=1 Tax=Dichomitus squalens TaxID=114155 RepID=A0A4Q9MAV6_9APHY|nr:hypothetical protein BD311DRAFT_781759 [Dichomitus squalens]
MTILRAEIPDAIGGLAVDGSFKWDVIDPRTNLAGLRIGKIIDDAAFHAIFRRESEQGNLKNVRSWVQFVHHTLTAEDHVVGLDAISEDVAYYGGHRAEAIRAPIAADPTGDVTSWPRTEPTMYNSLHGLLADIIATQCVWYKAFFEGPHAAEKLRRAFEDSTCAGFRNWYQNPTLNALYIVSIRRTQRDPASGKVYYFPELVICV